jgi:predicted amidohydrolase
MRTNLIAVQARMGRDDYATEAAFRTKIAALMAEAARKTDFALPTLVAFPELIGMYIGPLLAYPEEYRASPTFEGAGRAVLGKLWQSLPEEHRPTPVEAVRRLLFVTPALEAERVYRETFASLAREYQCYISAGSIPLPPIDSEPAHGGRYVVDQTKVYNTAFLFAPNGMCIGRTPKVNMTAGNEALLFDPAPVSEVFPTQTAIGKVGTLVCLDGFHENLVSRLDAMDAQVLLKPSYNQQSWDGPCSYDASAKEGERWLATGCPSIIQGRENIRFGVNPMMVGAVFEDTMAEGLSTIARNTGDPCAPWDAGLLAMATDPGGEEVLVATVEL